MVSNFWRKFWGWFGTTVPGGEPTRVAADETAQPPAAASTPWVLGFDSPVPELSGAMVMPASTGYRFATFPFGPVSLGELNGRFWMMVELGQQWQTFGTGRPFPGYLVLAGPGWELDAFFENTPGQVEWFVLGLAGTTHVSGAARPEQFLQAMALWPDAAAVVEWLRVNAFRSPDFGAMV